MDADSLHALGASLYCTVLFSVDTTMEAGIFLLSRPLSGYVS